MSDRAVIRSTDDAWLADRYEDIGNPQDGCGGKARTLAALMLASLPVPAFFVVRHLTLVPPPDDPPVSSAWAYATMINRAHIDERVHRSIVAQAIRLNASPGPDEHPLLAVRSSSAQEDARRTSFAGQFRSFLGVGDTAGLSRRIKEVWASEFLRRATHYRRAIGAVPTATDLMPVIVQRQIAARASGVLFTRNPAQPSQTLVEAVLGTGESLVGGSADPDRIVVEQDGRHHYTVGAKEDATLVLDPFGSVSCPVPRHLRRTRVLTDDQIEQLLVHARRVESVVGAPSDVEFAVDPDGGLWIVQARPITTG